ncbi:MAG: hypothetical protein ABII71_00140 [Candidatus Micrarchaeota archaeon]
MAEYEAELMPAWILVIPALVIAGLAAGFLISGKEFLIGIALITALGVILYAGIIKRSIRSYTVMPDRIVIEGIDREIPIGDIKGIELRQPRIMGIFDHDGMKYILNKEFASKPGHTSFVPPTMVHLYTTVKNRFTGMNSCFLLTPKDKAGLVREVQGILEKRKR